ncbi:MAG: hypothetical protein ACFFCE_19685 [Promethearchaeota archaeon]
MIIESVKIKNIRSIKEREINFPPSIILFFGDIGSGKSSVLKAIEFCLFGTLTAADLNGDSLLRRGEKSGSVELTFSINGKIYTIKRGLTRSKKKEGSKKKVIVSQEIGSFIEHFGDESVEKSYAPTDLRRKILEILKYSITRYEKAQKIPLFRYTVYTPQEQVKEILQAKPDERFEILKEVFGIEKYEIALKNVGIINEFLKNRRKKIKVQLNNIGNPEELIPKKERERLEQNELIIILEKNKKEKEKEIEKEQLKVDKIQYELNEYSKKFVKIENYKRNIDESTESKNKNEISLESLLNEISNSLKEIKNLPELKFKSDLTENMLEEQIEKNRKIQLEKDKLKAVLEKKIENINKLLIEGKCSLCGQEIHEEKRFNSELKNTNKEIERLSTEIKEINSEISNTESNLKNLREYNIIQTKREALNKLIEEKKKRGFELKDLINQLKDKIKNNQNQILVILKDYEIKDLNNFKEFENKLELELTNQKNLIKNLKREYSDFEKEINSKQVHLKLIEQELNELKNNRKKKTKLKDKIEYIINLNNWITEEFQILIRDIEREIISTSAQHFNKYFKEWFRILVEDENIEVEIRLEDFEPVITVNGYNTPFRDLSGGEKSALSLAYRLALNKIINERYQEVKTKDLLILDEPTDGFSQEQINKMQDIFERLNTAQMIIISHDRNLDSFVTDIFHFKKENHITKIKKEII